MQLRNVSLPDHLDYLFEFALVTNPHYPIRYGFECGKGWWPIIIEALEKIEQRDLGKIIRVMQVKEKFGELRIYLNMYNPSMEEIIKQAKEKCWRTCEVCGGTDAGLMVKGTWYKTLCHNCDEGYEMVGE